MQEIVDLFNHSQDRIWVNKVTIADISVKAMVAIGGGDPPDVIGMFNYNIPQYAEAGAVLPIAGFYGSEDLREEYYTPAVWKLLTHEGKQWGGVSTCHSLALYYNRSVFRDGGIADPPRTIAELDAISERLTTRDPDGRLRAVGFHPSIPDWWLYYAPYAFGGDLYNAETDTATIASPEGVRAYEWVSRTAARLGREPGRAFASSFARSIDSAGDPFFTGRVPMILQGPWIANFASAYAPKLDYAVAPFPVDEQTYDASQPITLIEADVLMIPKGCPHPEAAFEFVKFTQRRDIHEKLSQGHCKPSGLRSVSDIFIATHPHRYIKVHNDLMQSPRARIQPRTRAWKEYNDLIMAAFDAIWAGADVQSQLNQVQARTQRVIDLSAQRLKQRRLSVAGPAHASAWSPA